MRGSFMVRRPLLQAGAPRRGRHRLLMSVGPALVAVALAGRLLAPDLLDEVAPVIALSGIVLGVPHGAVDHMLPFWTRGRRPRAVDLGRVFAGYVAVAALAAAALLLAPTATVGVFLLVSAVHFGRAEVVVPAEDAGRPVPGPAHEWLPTAAHGLAVVGLPLVLWPGPSAAVLGRLGPGWQEPLSSSVRASLGVACAVVLWLALRAAVGRPPTGGGPTGRRRCAVRGGPSAPGVRHVARGLARPPAHGTAQLAAARGLPGSGALACGAAVRRPRRGADRGHHRRRRPHLVGRFRGRGERRSLRPGGADVPTRVERSRLRPVAAERVREGP
jgi:hypothetical protein